MKKTLTLGFLLLTAAVSEAQITLNQSSYASWSPNADTLRAVADTSTVASLAGGTNMSWDISSSTYTATSYLRMNAAATLGNFPSATFNYDAGGSLGPGLSYNGKVWCGLGAAGIREYGVSNDRQAFSLAAVTAGPFDSLVFPTQVSAYTSADNILNFPATYGTTWTSDYDVSINFNLTVALLAYNNEPGFRKTNTTVSDSVIGWGKIRVYNPNTSGPSDWINVLAVKVFTQTIDSFYLNGTPIDDATLGAFDLYQGMEGYNFQTYFYREGEVTPLVVSTWADQTYSIPTSVIVHTEKLHDPAGVKELTMNNDFDLFPNPSTDGKLYLSARTSLTGKWSYSVNAMNGQNIASGDLNFDNGKAAITANATPGLYTVSIIKDGVVVAMKSWFTR